MNIRLIKTLGGSWLAFLATGLVIKLWLSAPPMTLVIDRSYCSAEQWSQVARTYTDLYRQHRQQKIRLQSVIFFSHFDQETFEAPPPPATVETLSTYGQLDSQRQSYITQRYPEAKVLGCHH